MKTRNKTIEPEPIYPQSDVCARPFQRLACAVIAEAIREATGLFPRKYKPLYEWERGRDGKPRRVALPSGRAWLLSTKYVAERHHWFALAGYREPNRAGMLTAIHRASVRLEAEDLQRKSARAARGRPGPRVGWRSKEKRS